MFGDCGWKSWRCVLLVWLMVTVSSFAQDARRYDLAKPLPTRMADASDEFFSAGHVPELRLSVADADLQKLRENPRNYVRSQISEDGQKNYKSVGLKLKGAAGSFQDVDQKPAFTLNFDKFTKKQDFHAIEKLYLNNSVQDESFANEWLCSLIFRAAGIPAPRVGHARVWLNERDLGLFVIKEAYDSKFIKRYFENSKGNLYDGGFLQELDAPLEKDDGDGVDDRSDLQAIVAACHLPPNAANWKQLAELVDVDQFVTFMALELSTCHWDGYCHNRNNYRVYFHPTNGRAHFLPHGMDQMFQDPGFSIIDFPPALLATAVMQNAQWRGQYRQRLRDLMPLFAPATGLQKEVDKLTARLKPVVQKMGEDRWQHFSDRIAEVKQRLHERAEHLTQQIEQPDPQPLAFNKAGQAALRDWFERVEDGNAQVERRPIEGDAKQLLIRKIDGEHIVASWRSRVLLERGRYRLEAKAKATGVKPIEGDQKVGAGLRISGSERDNKLIGTTAWKPLVFSFEVEERRFVELVLELRATAGQVEYEVASLRLVKQ